MGFERLYGGRLLRSSFFKKKIKLESKINQIDKESKQAGVYFLFFFFFFLVLYTHRMRQITNYLQSTTYLPTYLPTLGP